MIEFTIPGDPKRKERPQTRVIKTKSGKYTAQVYTPSQTKENEKLIRTAYMLQCGSAKVEQGVPCAVHIRAGYPIPKSRPKREKELMTAGKLLPLVKPDVDNVAKVILDALNGVAYDDDSQVVMLTISKTYMEFPETTVIIQEMRGDRR
jgi:Holliday junction resolvase RusA-like endonuclease